MLQNLTRCTIPCACHAKRHLNLQKWSKHVVFWTFWLRNVLRATTACTFSTSQLPEVVRTWCVLYILTSKCAPRHNGVQFFISHLASWLRTRRFSEPTFRPSRNHKSLEKHSVSILSYLFACLDLLPSETFPFLIFFLLFSSLLLLFPSVFHLSILSEVWLLNFLRRK